MNRYLVAMKNEKVGEVINIKIDGIPYPVSFIPKPEQFHTIEACYMNEMKGLVNAGIDIREISKWSFIVDTKTRTIIEMTYDELKNIMKKIYNNNIDE